MLAAAATGGERDHRESSCYAFSHLESFDRQLGDRCKKRLKSHASVGPDLFRHFSPALALESGADFVEGHRQLEASRRADRPARRLVGRAHPTGRAAARRLTAASASRPSPRRRRRPRPAQPDPARDRHRHPPPLLRGRRGHRDDEHVHGDAIGQADYALEAYAAEMSREGARLARQAADEAGGLVAARSAR